MQRVKSNPWLLVAAAGMLMLAAVRVDAAPITELPSNNSNGSALGQSILAAPRYEIGPVLMADEFSLENAPAPPICGACDLNASPADEPSIFAPIITDVPEPASVLLAAAGLGLLWALRLCRRASA